MSNMTAGLIITLIGMGLVFAALLLLWGLMDIMVRLANRFFPDHDDDEGGSDEDIDSGEDVELIKAENGPETNLRAQAAAAAVAVSLSLRSRIDTAAAAAVAVVLGLKAQRVALSTELSTPSTSSWQAVHRANRLSQRLNLFSRKTGRN